MEKFAQFQTYFSSTSLQDGVAVFALDLVITAVLAYFLGLLYIKFGKALSNRSSFAHNFILLALTTMTIISVVKSSLALSLGLVGALSIVRFRAAIKDPEELTYLFAVISLGLGMGAGQRYIVLVSFLAFVCVIMLKGLKKKEPLAGNFYVNLSFDSLKDVSTQKVSEILKKYSPQVSFKRLDDSPKAVEFVFTATIHDAKNLDAVKTDLKKNFDNVSISFMEDNGLFNF